MAQFPDDALVRITFNSAALVEAASQARTAMDEARAGALRANDTIAHRIQQAQLKFLQDSIASTGRPQRDTEFLVQALGNEAYVEYDAEHFTVGTDAVLNDPQISPYWRGLEYSSSAHVGHTLFGYFRSVEGRKYPAMAERFRQDARLIQVNNATPSGKRRNQSLAFPIVIEHEIPEYAFLRRGIEEITPDIDQIYYDSIPGLR